MFTLSTVTIQDYKTMCISATITQGPQVNEHLNQLQAYAKKHNLPPKGYFVKYLNATQSDNMAAQFCLIVDELQPAEGNIQPKEMPGYKAKFVTSSNIPFENIAPTYPQMERWIAEQGYRTPSQPLWELYNQDNTAYIMWPVV